MQAVARDALKAEMKGLETVCQLVVMKASSMVAKMVDSEKLKAVQLVLLMDVTSVGQMVVLKVVWWDAYSADMMVEMMVVWLVL